MLKVYVYYNLHKKCWSVRALSGPSKGLVIAHKDEVQLFDCEFRVSEAGRRRVLREQRKNVHAGVVGYLRNDIRVTKLKAATEVTYNPYKYDSFVVKSSPAFKVQGADVVLLTNTRQVIANDVRLK